MNGLYMLVAQAQRACELFTGEAADSSVIGRIVSDISFDTQNIILIGMPGCGKSVVGRKIAELLGRPFLDADGEFLKMHGITPAEAIATLGEEKFRDLEHKTLSELCRESGAVIATGGGAVTYAENYGVLRQNGTVVYLRRELSRLSTAGRPLSQRDGVEALYGSRRGLYEHFAHIALDSTEDIALTAELIIEKIKESLKK
jgi:shikimate dehydrogenase